MIRNQWYVILESSEVKAGRPVGVTRLGEKMVLWRTESGKVNCMVDLCPHLGAQLSQGKVVLQDERLACPFHGFEYDASGQCVYIPALGKNGIPPKAMRVKIYPIYEAHGLIWVWWGEARDELPPPAFFDIDDSFSYSGYRDPWPVHYSRMVENQLDVLHLPFVHHNTIGRGGRTVVDGPVYRMEGNRMQIWVYNRQDDGTPPCKPEDLPTPERPPFLEFIFPNIWQKRITEDLRIFVAFVPVDEENGIFYLRQYQRMVRMPVVRDVFNWLSIFGNRYIANQDKAIVSRQRPKKTALKMDDQPIASDRLILAYRRKRKELQDQD